MKKLKHSKYKNTGILFEMLVQKLTSETLSSNKSTTADIIKKYFGKNTELSKELYLYNILIKKPFITEAHSLDYIRTTKLAHSKLNQSLLRRQRYNLIKEISEKFIFKNMSKMHITNYKVLASVGMIFDYEESDNPKQLMECKSAIIDYTKPTKKQNVQIDPAIKLFESQTKDIIEYEKPIPVIEGDRETVLSLISQTYSVGNANIKRHVWSASENAMIVDSNSTSIVNVKFLKTGPSIIYIWQESLQGCVGVDSIIVMVKSPSGISTNNQSSSVPYTIYPNPTGDANQIILQFSEAQKEHIDIELLDILGNQMYMSSLNIGDQSTTIPIHNLCSGMYMLRIHMNNEVYMEKVIVN